MSFRNTSGASAVGRDRYILFSMWKCSKCQDLKRNISSLIADGTVTEVDVSQIPQDSQMMRVFRIVSPDALVPALGVIRGQNLIGKQVGVVNIKRTLRV